MAVAPTLPMCGSGSDRAPFTSRLVETHVSHVLFIGDQVYKLKKPVVTDFLDFRTADARRAGCDAEVNLNRRLAPDVYLGVANDSRDRLAPEAKGAQVGASTSPSALETPRHVEARLHHAPKPPLLLGPGAQGGASGPLVGSRSLVSLSCLARGSQLAGRGHRRR